ncbi:hypothetical protein BCR39DRAFT_74335 [Naematelia encephala]|uniref:DUF1765-domain-containing protein n=1 Tax=Naematelia encephala TaxID=71784 RepID=A0A1Y2AEQ3_9TREE|nr:hypothetical protein BCR39DRAFT_74335 [Naematelia encephala]
MLVELRVEQAATERGSCLEALACAMESSCLSEEALQESKRHHDKFDSLMIECMSFVMGKLGAKGVFHNMLLFSGRFLAFAFFRVPHVGEQLVTVLQPPRGALMRFTRSALIDESVPLEARPTFPPHLAGLCFDDSRTYTARLASLTAEFATEEERDAFLFQPGNWLRRWQSDDSELFPAFYRAYHRQLAIYLTAAIKHYEGFEQPLPASLLLRAPGYAHLATIFAKKCHSYILGSVNAVTTSSNAQNFEATETAGFRGSQKPAVLETANRRLVETLSTFANIRVNIPDGGSILEVEGQQLYSSMLDLWTKSIIAKTSLYAPKGVFCLFDLLDGIVDPPVDFISGERDLKAPSLIDVPHLIHVVRLILTQGEHALTLVKVIAFVFTHWEVLTTRAEDRRQLCQELFLSKEVFERLLLFWSQSVRSYVLRLVVFRLGHLHTTKDDGEAHKVEIESVRLLQTRLDRIKRRHDELEPVSLGEGVEAVVPLTPIEGSGGMTRSRSTITMVADSPRRGSSNKAERLLGLGFGQQESKGEIEVDGVAGSKVGKATNWLKKSFGGASKKRRKDGSTSESPSPNLDSSPLLGTSPNVPRASPSVKQSPLVPSAPSMPSPVSPHSDDTTGSASPTETSTRRPRPPKITTTSPSAASTSSSSPTAFAFEFELPTMSPRSDHFDPSPSALANGSPRAKRTSQPPSPHMSRSFSKRASLLPPSTANALAQELAVAAGDNLKREAEERAKEEKAAQDKGYDKKLHAYAIRMLAELEDAQKEYDEWWADGGVGRVGGCPPRLTVAWPFHEGEE